MQIRVSLASMLTALAVLAAHAVTTRAQAPEPGPSANAGGPEAGASAQEVAPEVAARPSAAGAKTNSDTRSQAEIIANRLARNKKQKEQKWNNEKEEQVRFERWQIQWMILQANRQIELARQQMALMEGYARREAEARMARLQDDLNACRPPSVFIGDDDDDDYGNRNRYRPTLKEQVDYYNATTHQAFQRLASTLSEAIRSGQTQQGPLTGLPRGTPGNFSGGTPGSMSPSRGSTGGYTGGASGGYTGPSFTPSFSNGGVPRTPPTPPTSTPSRNNTASGTADAERAARNRYKP